MAEDKPESRDHEPHGMRAAFTWASRAVVWKESLMMGAIGLFMGPVAWALLRMFVVMPDPISNMERAVSAAAGAAFGLLAGLDKGLRARDDAQKNKPKDQAKDGTPPAP